MAIDRPQVRYPLHDIGGTSFANLPTSNTITGFQANEIADESAVNALMNATGLYLTYLDCRGIGGGDWASGPTTPAVRLTAAQFGYPTLAGLTVSPNTQPVYLFEGIRLEVDEQITRPLPPLHPGSAILQPITFTASMRTWIYSTASGITSLSVVALGTPAAPPAGTFAMVGIDTDGFDIVALEYTDTPDHELRVDAIQLRFTQPLNVEVNDAAKDALTVSNSLGRAAVFVGTSAVTSAVDITNSAGTALTVSGASTVDDLTVLVGKTLLVEGSVQTNGGVSLGNDSGSTIVLGGGLTDNLITKSVLTFGEDGDLGAKKIAGTAASSVDVGTAKVDKITWDVGSLPPTDGDWSYSGTAWLARGFGGQLQSTYMPRRGWDAAFTTGSAIDTTTCAATRRLSPTEDAWIEISLRAECDIVTAELRFRLEITGPLGTVEVSVTNFALDQAGRAYSVHRTIQWRPSDSFAAVGDQAYVFVLRLGVASGGVPTLDAENISMKVTSAVQL